MRGSTPRPREVAAVDWPPCGRYGPRAAAAREAADGA